ncbi:MAG: hypothetical protein ACI4KM_11630 [Oscillospiraceae bacterium]
MLITADEYKAMGFTAEDETELDNCLKRAEYILAGITDGRAELAVERGGKPAEYVKRAAAFQTYLLLQKRMEEKNSEKVSIGDFSYSAENSRGNLTNGLYDMSHETVRLLRASGILFSGTEVRD